MERLSYPIQLPSRCIPYEGVDPNSIKICTLTGEDEFFISDITVNDFDEKFCQLCDRTLIGIDSRKLTLGDRTFLLVWQCIHSYTSTIDEEVICPLCAHKHVQQIDLGKININFLESIDPEVELSDKSKLKLRLLTTADQLSINNFERSGANSWQYTWALTIANGKDVLHNIEFLNKLSAADNARIRGWHKKHSHGPDMKVDILCPFCKETSTISLPFRLRWLIRSIT